MKCIRLKTLYKSMRCDRCVHICVAIRWRSEKLCIISDAARIQASRVPWLSPSPCLHFRAIPRCRDARWCAPALTAPQMHDGADTRRAPLRSQCCMRICTTLEEPGLIAFAEGHPGAVLNLARSRGHGFGPLHRKSLLGPHASQAKSEAVSAFRRGGHGSIRGR
jgi:hypothetical protein